MFVFRVDSALLYFNVEFVRDQFAAQLAAREDAIHTAVFFLGSTPAIDLAGADLLIDLRRHLAARGIDLRLAGARGQVQQDLIRAGLEPAAVEGYADVEAALGRPSRFRFQPASQGAVMTIKNALAIVVGVVVDWGGRRRAAGAGPEAARGRDSRSRACPKS